MKLLLAALITISATLPLYAQVHPADMKGPKILIAYEQTSLKKQLITEMKKMLIMSGINVVLAVHAKERPLTQNAADYSVVFITNSGDNAQVRPWIQTWIDKNKEYHNRIILHTTQKNTWEIKTSVDAVTSASAEENVRELTLKYCGAIMKKLMPQPPAPAAE